MKKLYFSLLCSIFCLFSSQLFAQFGQLETGARSYGMGRTSLTLNDAFAVFNNIAALSNIEQTQAFVNYTNRFSLANINALSAGAAIPTFYNGVAGIGVMRFGDELYNEHRLALGYSHKISNYSIGVQVNYLQLSIQNYGTRSAFALEMGGTAQLAEQLFLGMHIFNINQAQVTEFEDERIPTLMRIGLSYRPLERVMVNLETEKDTEYPASFKAGLEYQVIQQQVIVRTGITTEPFIASFGAGYYHKNFGFDYALTQLPNVGFSHHVGIIYRFNKKRVSDSEEK